MFTFSAGRWLPVLLTVVGLVAACATGTGSSPSVSVSYRPTATPSSPSASARPTTLPTVAPTPTAAPEVGLAWSLVDDPDVASYPNMGGMDGVIAGGPGAIAWGQTWGPAAANGGLPHLGPKIWTTADGTEWVPAVVEAPTDAHPAQPGEVSDIASAPGGYVAIGSYYRTDDGLAALVWTSTDGRAWRRIQEQAAFDGAVIERVVSWRGGLLVYGCHRVTAMDCGREGVWTSTYGTSWTEGTLALPDEGVTVGLVAAGPDRLWGQTNPEITNELPAVYQAAPPTRVTSLDGLTWTPVELPVLGIERFHPLSVAAFLTVAPVPDDGTSLPPSDWVTRTPGVYRSTDLLTWEGSPSGKLGGEIVEVGDTLVMLGTTGTQCWNPGRCVAAAWRSTDAGQTWTAVPVTGPSPKDRPGGTMRATAALADGTLVAVGDLRGTDGIGVTATWVSPPQPGS